METPIDRFFSVQRWNEIEQSTGLKFIGNHKLGAVQSFDYYQCAKCGSDYPDMGNGPQANGKVLKHCLCSTEESR